MNFTIRQTRSPKEPDWNSTRLVRVVMGAILVGCTSAVGEDDRVVESSTSVFDPMPAAILDRPVLRAEQVDRWISTGALGDQGARIARQLEDAVDTLDRKYGLSSEQRARLVLAGKFDQRCYWQSVEELRQRVRDGNEHQLGLREICLEASELRRLADRGLFGSDSLFEKVAQTSLQRDYSPAAIERMTRYHRRIAEEVAREIENRIDLRAAQRETLVELLLTIPPPITSGHYDRIILMYQLSVVPRDELRRLLEDAQWSRFQRVLDQYRSTGKTLEAQGIDLEKLEGRVLLAVKHVSRSSDRQTSSDEERKQ